MDLTSADFPLYAIGALVYRRTLSSPLFTAPNSELAADLVARLNRDYVISAHRDQTRPTNTYTYA